MKQHRCPICGQEQGDERWEAAKDCGPIAAQYIDGLEKKVARLTAERDEARGKVRSVKWLVDNLEDSPKSLYANLVALLADGDPASSDEVDKEIWGDDVMGGA